MDPKASNLEALRIDRSGAPAQRRSGVWRWVLPPVLLLAAGGGWWATRPRGIAVQTTTVQARGTAAGGNTLLNASGYVTTRLEATVSSKVTGKIVEVLVEEGMKVEKDQILARLDDSNVQASLRLAKAQLDAVRLILSEAEPVALYAEGEHRRLASLIGRHSVSKADLAKAESEARVARARVERLKAEVRVAEHQVAEWEQQFQDTIIRAPFAGVVTTKDAQPGEMISPMSAGGSFTRTGICTLVDMNSLEIEVDVNESFIQRVQAGQPVAATLDAYPDWKIPCKVIAIVPTADRQKATVKVRVGLEGQDPRILPQMGVKVAFQSAEPAAAGATRTLSIVPKEALRQVAGRDVAWVVRDGKAERRAVSVQGKENGEIVVGAGLNAGETVILDAPDSLAEGTVVTVKPPP